MILQAAGGTGGENSFHITRSAFALGAKAGFTPEDALTNDPLGNVIGGLDILIFHKGPEILLCLRISRHLPPSLPSKRAPAINSVSTRFWSSGIRR